MVGGSRAFQASGWASDGGMPLEVDAFVRGEQPVPPRVLAVRIFFRTSLGVYSELTYGEHHVGVMNMP